jgi:hypothetical protein
LVLPGNTAAACSITIQHHSHKSAPSLSMKEQPSFLEISCIIFIIWHQLLQRSECGDNSNSWSARQPYADAHCELGQLQLIVTCCTAVHTAGRHMHTHHCSGSYYCVRGSCCHCYRCCCCLAAGVADVVHDKQVQPNAMLGIKITFVVRVQQKLSSPCASCVCQ